MIRITRANHHPPRTIMAMNSFVKSAHFSSTYDRNALEGLEHLGLDSYMVTVSKESEGCWVVYAEDHEPADIAAHLEGPERFKTRREAIAAGAEFAFDFAEVSVKNAEEESAEG